MMNFAYFLLSSFVVVACQYSHRLAEEVEKQELAYKSDSTITIDMEECVVAQKRFYCKLLEGAIIFFYFVVI